MTAVSTQAPARTSAPGPGAKAHLSHRMAERGVDRSLLLLLPGLFFLVVLFIYPFLNGLSLSFQPVNKHATDAFWNYRQFFTQPYLYNSLIITLRISLPAALINVLASIPIAFRLRGRFRGKRLLTTLLVIPITLGTVLTAEGMINYLGPAGWLNKVLIDLHVTTQDSPIPLIKNYWGVVISLIISGFPFAFLLILSYLSGIDPSLDAAAATLGASATKRFWQITFPLLAPGLAITFCLTFVLAFSVFPSAYLVGDPTNTTHVISITAYDAAYSDFDYSMASAVAMIMATVMLLVISLVLWGRSRLYRGATGGKG
ncbi:MAG: ABC transporter permease [Actinobacteria bacterium 13_1_20CM_3_71_11]|nr:MAG: ABC transporter permease [Actinobacteria bacterium 13_1_20CM_3_71_11]